MRSSRRPIFKRRSRLKPWWLPRAVAGVFVVAFLALLAYGLTTKAANTTLDDALSQGRARAAPGFRLAMLADGRPGTLEATWTRAANDRTIRLDEFRGVPVVLNFWASWCDPCRGEAGRLERAWQQSRRRGVLFLGLNQQDAREDAGDFLRQFAITFPQVRDPGKETAQAWGVTGIPETFFIDRRGRVVSHVIGVVDDDQLQRGVEAALLGRPLGVSDGGEQRSAP